jgi:hypothetical protein
MTVQRGLIYQLVMVLRRVLLVPQLLAVLLMVIQQSRQQGLLLLPRLGYLMCCYSVVAVVVAQVATLQLFVVAVAVVEVEKF